MSDLTRPDYSETVTSRILAPAYLSRFHCIGPDCEDTCCVGWQIVVDRPTLDRYRTVDHPELGPQLRAKVLETPGAQGPGGSGSQGSGAGNSSGGRIELGADHSCPFLQGDRLCRIHAELGEEFLSLTCTSYPRKQTIVDGVGVRAASLSCPEAARLALLDPDAMELEVLADPERGRVAGSRVDTAGMDPASAWDQFHRVRDSALSLLRSRSVPLETRLYALGLVFRNLGEEDVLLDDDVRLAFAGIGRRLPALAAEMAHLEPPLRRKFQLLSSLFEDQFQRVGGGLRHGALVSRAAAGLGYVDGADPDCLAAACARASREHLDPYFERRPYALENYVVNQVLATPFPFAPGRSWFDEFVVLVLKLAVVRFLLSGLAAHERRMDDALLVEAVQVFGRAVDHSSDYLAALKTRLK